MINVPSMRAVISCFVFAVTIASTGLSSVRCSAQIGGNNTPGSLGNGYPSEMYFQALSVYRSGDIEDALEMFDRAHNFARIDGNGRWIDSIPVYAMQAECHWHLGNLEACSQALQQAMAIAIRRRGWLSNIDWGPIVKPAAVNAINSRLWPAANAVIELPIAERLTHTSGINLLQQSQVPIGVIEEQNAKVVNVVEIMRSMAVVSYRRRMLLGPLTRENALSREMLDASKYPARLQQPVARGIIAALRGAEYFAAGDDKATIEQAMKSAVINGGVHPLSPLMMLCQAHALSHAGETRAAVAIANQCVNVSARLGQDEWIGEAMQIAAGCASPAEAVTVQQTATVAGVAMIRRSRLAALHGLLAASDAALTAGNVAEATRLLEQSRQVSTHRDVVCPRLDAYGAYLGAAIATVNGSTIGGAVQSDADTLLKLIAQFGLNHRTRRGPLVSIPRLFQASIVASQIGNSLGGKTSERIIEDYMADPAAIRWRRDPVDAIVDLMADKSQLEFAWLNLAAMQSGSKDLVRRMDFLLASRYRRSKPLGGRLMQLRGLTQPNDELLGETVKEFLLKTPPPIKELRNAAAAALPADTATRVAAAVQLESLTSRIALSRIAFPHTTPRRLETTDLEEILPPKTGVLVFFRSGKRILGSFSRQGETETWVVPGSERIANDVGNILKKIGVGAARGKRLPEPEDDSWRVDSARLFQRLFPSSDSKPLMTDLDQLVVVPDGSLWYLPFELLVPDADQDELLSDTVKIRYAATPGLAVFPVARPSQNQTVAIVANKFFAPADSDVNDQMIGEIAGAVDLSIRLPKDEPAPASLIGDRFGHLFVGAATTLDPKNPDGYSVAAYDAATPAGSVAAWSRFPAPVPQTVVLSGLRTPVDLGRVLDGHEMFQLLCGLQSSGVREVLISRWALGGNSTAIVMKELLQELPFTGLAAGWRRAAGILRRTTLDPKMEPRLLQKEHDREDITGDLPFFWSGYLVSEPLNLQADPE